MDSSRNWYVLVEKLHIFHESLLIDFFNCWPCTTLSIASITRHATRHSSWHSTRHTTWHTLRSSSSLVQLCNDRSAYSFNFLLLAIKVLFRCFLVLIQPLNDFFTFVNHSFAVFFTDFILNFFILNTLLHIVSI